MEKIINFIKNLSVTWKFIFAYSSVVIIPIIIIAMYLYFQTSAGAITQAKMLMEQNLSGIKSSIMDQVKIIENMSQIVSYDQKIDTFLESSFIQDVSGIENYKYNIISFVDNVSRQNKDIYSMRVYMKNPTIPEIYDNFFSIRRIENKDWYKEFSRKSTLRSYWRTSHQPSVYIKQYAPNQDNDVFSFCSKIYSLNENDPVGILEVEVKEKTLLGVLRNPITDELGSVFVVDHNGIVVSDNKPELYLKNLKYTAKIASPNIASNKVEAVNGAKSIVISIPAKEIGCSIIGIFPVKNFTGKVKDMIPILVCVSLLSALFLGLIVYFITIALLKRIKILVKAMKQVREGNLNISVDVNSKDEFGELALSFNNMTTRIHDLVETVYKIQLMEREAELRALQVQINPHFLYNTLATVSWAARKVNSKEIYQISNSLAKFYRLVLSEGNTLIMVKQEVDMVKAYLDIQKIRFESLFDIEYDIDEIAYEHKIVKNLLQPLVENALNHGIQPKGGQGIIGLKIHIHDDMLVFEICDNGIGMTIETVNAILTGKMERTDGSGYALKNIMERLKANYDDRYIFTIDSEVGIGTTVSIKINMDKTA